MNRLAAIGAADVPSYMQPMEADREGAPARLTSSRRALIDPNFALRNGRALKTAAAVQAAPITAR